MKHILFLVGYLGCIIFLSGCTKDGVHFKPRLTGSWELRDIKGGFFGPGGPPDVTPGNGNMLKFSDSEYQFYSRGQLITRGTYIVIKKDTYNGSFPADALVLDSLQYEFARFTITKNTLTIYHGSIAADGYIAKYARQ
jgi:hypothetical protein